MTQEVIKSVGIDIGTSTTQLVFSRLTIENTAGQYSIPRIKIVEKEVIYRSDIYFTPLISQTELDVNEIKKIIKKEYEKAGMTPDMLSTGAVIITGDTARKSNADQVLNTLSDMAGEFVVATAGPDLESMLAGRGAGADVYSKENRNTVINLDIGGGTSNLVAFDKGNPIGVSCVDIGGRLIKIKNGKIDYIFSKIQTLAKENGIDINCGDVPDRQKLERLCEIMAGHLAMACGLKARDPSHKSLYTNAGSPLKDEIKPDALTFSGGVADFIYNEPDMDVFKYGDIGILLAMAVKKEKSFQKIPVYRSAETIRATVVGAGTHTTEVSGSTIAYGNDTLPVRNVPVLKIPDEAESKTDSLVSFLKDNIPVYLNESTSNLLAIGLSGNSYFSFDDVQVLSDAIIRGAEAVTASGSPLIIVLENDIAKVLGNAIKIRLENRREVICIDGVHTSAGDYIDIGVPLSGGRVVPVVIKTLIFNT